MKQIPLTQGKFALVDDADYEQLCAFKWHTVRSNVRGLVRWYARGPYMVVRGQRVRAHMHRRLMGFPDSIVDHIDGDGLNNQRDNLRTVTKGQNRINSVPQRHRRFKGTEQIPCGKWRARLFRDGKHAYLGSYVSEEEAALAYNYAAKHYNGEYARLNDVHA